MAAGVTFEFGGLFEEHSNSFCLVSFYGINSLQFLVETGGFDVDFCMTCALIPQGRLILILFNFLREIGQFSNFRNGSAKLEDFKSVYSRPQSA